MSIDPFEPRSVHGGSRQGGVGAPGCPLDPGGVSRKIKMLPARRYRKPKDFGALPPRAFNQFKKQNRAQRENFEKPLFKSAQNSGF